MTLRPRGNRVKTPRGNVPVPAATDVIRARGRLPRVTVWRTSAVRVPGQRAGTQTRRGPGRSPAPPWSGVDLFGCVDLP